MKPVLSKAMTEKARPLLRSAPAPEPSFQHKLEQFNPGIVWLDAERRVTAMNDVAIQVLRPVAEPSLGIRLDDMFGIDVLMLHPPKSREKIAFLLGTSNGGNGPAHGGRSPPPQAMMINIPDRMLMIKVSQMVAADGNVGTCMIFYDLTDVTTSPRAAGLTSEPPGAEPVRLLSHIPVYRHNRIMLVDVKDIGRLEGEGHYTTIVATGDRYLSNLSLSVLESRLDPRHFMRVHRSHIVNLTYVSEIIREDDGFLVALHEPLGPPVPVSRQKLSLLKDRFGLS